MDTVQARIYGALRSQATDTSTATVKIECRIAWNPAQFLRDQYEIPTEANLCDVITITGIDGYFQAAKCSDYVQQTWHDTGEELLRAIQEYVRCQLLSTSGSITPLATKLSNGTWVEISLYDDTILVKCEGLIDAVTKIVEELAWLGAACRAHSTSEQLGLCSIDVDPQEDLNSHIRIAYSLTNLEPVTKTDEGDTYSWQRLFKNAVVVEGYPTRCRTHSNRGLELSMDLMLVLGEVGTLTNYQNGLVINGLQSMFVPVASTEDSIQWQWLFSNDMMMFSQADEVCPNRLRNDRLGDSDLKRARHFVERSIKC